MRGPLLVFVLALALGLGALLFLQRDDAPTGGGGPRDLGERPRGGGEAPSLEAGTDLASPRVPRGTDDPAANGRPAPSESTARLVAAGVVLASDTGRPVPGARVWAEPHQEPCPRGPDDLAALRGEDAIRIVQSGRVLDLSGLRAVTDADGRFELRWTSAQGGPPDLGDLDLFAVAKGHAPAVACAPPEGREVVLTLPRALPLGGTVRGPREEPVAEARVGARPAPGLSTTLGHVATAVTGETGDYVLDGLLAGAVVVTVDHPAYMPHQSAPVDPASRPRYDVRLVPALRLTLHLRSEDGRDIVNPVVAWATDGQPPRSELLMPGTTPEGPRDAERSRLLLDPLRLPCDRRRATLEVKADGYAPWRSAQPLELPAEGGEEEMEVVLRRDDSLASLRVAFENERGEPLPYAALGAVPHIGRLDGMALPSGIVLEAAETLWFPSLPAGPWRIGVTSADYAPASVQVELRAGATEEQLVTLLPPAKLKITFTHAFPSEAPVRVRFRLLKDGVPQDLFPEGGTVASENPAEGGAEASGNGTVFGGLGAGAHVIEVVTEGLRPLRHTVDLRTGDTTEVELEVERV
jgi:hypothetical protein